MQAQQTTTTTTAVDADDIVATVTTATAAPAPTATAAIAATTTTPLAARATAAAPPVTTWRGSKLFIVIAVFIGITADMLVYSTIIPILPFIVADLDGSSLLTGTLLAVYALGIVVSAPLFGYCADRWRNKRAPMVGGLAALLLAVLAMAFGTSFWLWVVARLLQGVSAGAIWSLGLALVADAYHDAPAGFAQAMSVIMVGYTVGTVTGPPIGGALYAVSHTAPFYFCAAVVLVDLVLRLIVVEPHRADDVGDDEGMVVGVGGGGGGEESEVEEEDVEEEAGAVSAKEAVGEAGAEFGADTAGDGKEEVFIVVVRSSSDGAAPAAAVGATETVTAATRRAAQRGGERARPVGFVEMLKSKPLLLVLGMAVVNGFLLGSFEPTLPTFLSTTYSLTTGQVGLAFFALVLPPIFWSPVAGYVAERYGARPLIPIAMTLTVGAEVLPGITVGGGRPALWWTLTALAVVASTIACALAPLVPEIAANVPRDAYAKAYSLFNVAWSLGTAFGPTLGSAVFQYAGWFWQCVFCASFAAVCLPLAYLYRPPERR